MIDRDAAWVAEAAGGSLAAGDPAAPGPVKAVLDTRAAGEGDLFAGLEGSRVDGGEYAPQALAAGAWGTLVAERHAERVAAAAGRGQVVIGVPDPRRSRRSRPPGGASSAARWWA
jgi:UDP-N-acetylmuramoyl-tripeptide--D-alanyl-D-alanine ligase